MKNSRNSRNRNAGNRSTGKTAGRIAAWAAAFLMALTGPAGICRADVVLASDGAQTGEETQTDSGTDAQESGQEDFTDLLSAEQKELLEELLEKLENGELSTREQIDGAIRQAQKELGITLSEDQKEQIAGLVLQADRLGLDREAILDGAQALYEKYGSAVMENANDAIRENIVEPVKEAAVKEVKKTFRDFFRDMGETVKNFVMDLIG